MSGDFAPRLAPGDRQSHASSTAADACDVAVVGAGPYGLSGAAHLARVRGLDVRVFGEPMSFWEGMPRGMLLRSNWGSCSIGFFDGDLTIGAYKSATGREFSAPVPLDEFIGYGRWFQRTAVPDVDRRRVVAVNAGPGGFRLLLEDGDTLRAGRVVVAAGIQPFAARPPVFDALPSELATHASEHRDLGRFADAEVLVVGGGQSALESAALLHESGARVEVIARRPKLVWLRGGTIHRRLGRFSVLVYAPTDVGPLGLSRLVAVPDLFRRLPRSVQTPVAYRSVRPAGARWLVSRLEGVPLTTGRSVVRAEESGGRVRVVLDEGPERIADHVLLGTGYRVDVARYSFLAPELLARIRCVNGYPVLRRGLESSVPGLHFLGAPATWSFGPIMRFVSGSWFGAGRLADRIRAAGPVR